MDCSEAKFVTSPNGAYVMIASIQWFQQERPLKPHFYIVKLGFTGVYIIIFLFLLKNIDCGYSLEPPGRGGSNGYPQSVFWAEICKISDFLSENFQFWVVKFSIYLNRRVFVMDEGVLATPGVSVVWRS